MCRTLWPNILSLEEWTVFSYNLNISTYIALFPRVPNTHLFPPLLKEKFIFRLISSIMLLTNPTVSVSPDFPGYSFTGGCFFSDFPGTIICWSFSYEIIKADASFLYSEFQNCISRVWYVESYFCQLQDPRKARSFLPSNIPKMQGTRK